MRPVALLRGHDSPHLVGRVGAAAVLDDLGGDRCADAVEYPAALDVREHIRALQHLHQPPLLFGAAGPGRLDEPRAVGTGTAIHGDIEAAHLGAQAVFATVTVRRDALDEELLAVEPVSRVLLDDRAGGHGLVGDLEAEPFGAVTDVEGGDWIEIAVNGDDVVVPVAGAVLLARISSRGA